MLKRAGNSISWQPVFAFTMFCMFLAELAGVIMPERSSLFFDAYGMLILASMAGVYLCMGRLSGLIEIKLYFAYILWLLITRWLNGDAYLDTDLPVVIEQLFCFLLFVTGTVLNEKQRDRLLSLLVLFYAGFYVVLCAAGLFATITNSSISIPPEHAVQIAIMQEKGVTSLEFTPIHRLINAARVYIAWALLVYAFAKRKNIFLRILIFLCLLLVFITIPLLHSRNIQIVMSVSCGMLALLVFMKPLFRKPNLIRIPMLTLITIAGLVFGFCSYNWSNSLVTELNEHLAPRYESHEIITEVSVSTSAQDQDTAVVAANTTDYSPDDLTEKRDISTNKTLSGRTAIWKSGLLALKHEPSIAAYGSLNDHYMDLVNDVLKKEVVPSSVTYFFHMHNMFLEVLLLAGIPGLLIILSWTVCMVIKMLRFYFSEPEDREKLPLKVLTIPIAGILTWHLAEVCIFTKEDILCKAFFLICGLFLGYFKDRFQTKTDEPIT